MTDLIAVVDLGSNAARFTLARIVPGREFRVLREERVQTRLGAGRGRALPRDAIAATVRATRRFLRSVTRGQSPRVLAIATAAVRDAGNDAVRLRSALRRKAGVELEILSGEDEARLGATAAMASLPVRDGIVLDLGGGSAQLTRVRRGGIEPMTSVPLGAVRLTRGHFRHDPPSPAEVRAVRREVRAHLGGVLERLGGHERLVAQGGTIRTLARMHLKAAPRRRSPIHGLRLRRADVSALRATLEALPLRGRRRLPGLKAERADIILAGAVVVEEIMLAGGYAALTVCERGVRHGLLLRETFSAEAPA
jgi:exopolyphosphatase/guanosine-5'-triphosphate,3'-diphosphate pyrophosphatase